MALADEIKRKEDDITVLKKTQSDLEAKLNIVLQEKQQKSSSLEDTVVKYYGSMNLMLEAIKEDTSASEAIKDLESSISQDQTELNKLENGNESVPDLISELKNKIVLDNALIILKKNQRDLLKLPDKQAEFENVDKETSKLQKEVDRSQASLESSTAEKTLIDEKVSTAVSELAKLKAQEAAAVAAEQQAATDKKAVVVAQKEEIKTKKDAADKEHPKVAVALALANETSNTQIAKTKQALETARKEEAAQKSTMPPTAAVATAEPENAAATLFKPNAQKHTNLEQNLVNVDLEIDSALTKLSDQSVELTKLGTEEAGKQAAYETAYKEYDEAYKTLEETEGKITAAESALVALEAKKPESEEDKATIEAKKAELDGLKTELAAAYVNLESKHGLVEQANTDVQTSREKFNEANEKLNMVKAEIAPLMKKREEASTALQTERARPIGQAAKEAAAKAAEEAAAKAAADAAAKEKTRTETPKPPGDVRMGTGNNPQVVPPGKFPETKEVFSTALKNSGLDVAKFDITPMPNKGGYSVKEKDKDAPYLDVTAKGVEGHLKGNSDAEINKLAHDMVAAFAASGNGRGRVISVDGSNPALNAAIKLAAAKEPFNFAVKDKPIATASISEEKPVSPVAETGLAKT